MTVCRNRGYFGECLREDCLFFGEACNQFCEHFGDEVDINVIVEGVGKDAELVENENGGKQSKSPVSLHLIDPKFMTYMLDYEPVDQETGAKAALEELTKAMAEQGSIFDKMYFANAVYALEPDKYRAFLRIGKVLQEGAEKYSVNNWRLISREEHINHALIHLTAAILGDTQDDHLDHALTRIMMSFATKLSDKFSFTEYKE